MDTDKLVLIKKINGNNKKIQSFVTDDNVIVVTKKKYDEESGQLLPSTVIGTITKEEIESELAALAEQTADLQQLLNLKWPK